MNYVKMIDHTLLKQDAAADQIKKLCREAVSCGFCSVCVNSSFVSLCAGRLKDTDVKVCTVIGFPLGAMSTGAKAAEAALAVKDGAQELDMVIHAGMAKSGDWDYVKKDIAAVVQAVSSSVFRQTALLPLQAFTCSPREGFTAIPISTRAWFFWAPPCCFCTAENGKSVPRS